MIPIELKFYSDTSQRKQWFSGFSFSHPAKMHLSLQIYLIEHYTKPGETILDPMAGSGTILAACALGRNVIAVELEKKFVDMQKANWEKVKSLGPMLGFQMGEAAILQGDARNLDNLLVDKCIFSPPYALTGVGDWKTGRAEFQAWVLNEIATKGYVEWQGKRYTEAQWRAMNHGRIDGRTTKGVHKHPTDGYGKTNGQVGNLPYGEISAVISSPPYGLGKGIGHGEKKKSKLRAEKYRSTTYTNNIDAVITSPPYEGIAVGRDEQDIEKSKVRLKKAGYKIEDYIGPSKNLSKLDYNLSNKENIGNLKSDNYLSAMLQVYRQCHRVLKEKGLMVLVVKNFIRDKKVVRLDTDTIKLCEQVGFTLTERLQRKLTQQSFWRIIYAQRYPGAPKIEFEDCLIFQKGV